MPLFAELMRQNAPLPMGSERQQLLKMSTSDKLQIYNKDTFVGIEIEVENYLKENSSVATLLWETRSDSSLRNAGAEFVSPPLLGNEIAGMLEIFYANLPKTIVFSQRTSIHVHINCLDLTTEEITRFVLLYLLFEKVLYRFIGRDRERNIFCVPLQDTYRVGTIFRDLQTKLHRPQDYHIADETTRYMGINLAALYEFGTLEFRQMHGTRDEKKVVTWINLLLAIKVFAVATDTKVLIERILSLNTTSEYRIFASEVFKEVYPELSQKHIDSDMEKGVYAVKYSVLADKFKQQLKKAWSALSPAALWLAANLKKEVPF